MRETILSFLIASLIAPWAALAETHSTSFHVGAASDNRRAYYTKAMSTVKKAVKTRIFIAFPPQSSIDPVGTEPCRGCCRKGGARVRRSDSQYS
jgi:hypothetical protein